MRLAFETAKWDRQHSGKLKGLRIFTISVASSSADFGCCILATNQKTGLGRISLETFVNMNRMIENDAGPLFSIASFGQVNDERRPSWPSRHRVARSSRVGRRVNETNRSDYLSRRSDAKRKSRRHLMSIITLSVMIITGSLRKDFFASSTVGGVDRQCETDFDDNESVVNILLV